jgi:hypothetical protein
MRQAMHLSGPLVAECIALFERHGGDWPDNPPIVLTVRPDLYPLLASEELDQPSLSSREINKAGCGGAGAGQLSKTNLARVSFRDLSVHSASLMQAE